MYLVHYYLQKGFAPDAIINLPYYEKLFYTASARLHEEETAAQYKAIFGGEG